MRTISKGLSLSFILVPIIACSIGPGFPSSSLADNAVYWMGECYAAQQRWDEAIAQYRLLRERYPDGDKVKSALLKEGMTLLEIGRQSEGETVLRELLKAFPRSEEARVAREQLAHGG